MRVIGLLQFIIGYVLLIFLKPNPVKDTDLYSTLTSMYMGGNMLFHAQRLDDLPAKEIIAEQVLILGVAVIGILLMSAYQVTLQILKPMLGW